MIPTSHGKAAGGTDPNAVQSDLSAAVDPLPEFQLQKVNAMETLELRVERLEKSCRRWRLGFLILLALGAAAAVANPNPLPDAHFAHLTVQSLTVRNEAGGPFISLNCDNDLPSLKIASPASSTLVAVEAGPNDAHVFVSRNAPAGLSSSALSADNRSGFIDIHGANGKSREIDPE